MEEKSDQWLGAAVASVESGVVVSEVCKERAASGGALSLADRRSAPRATPSSLPTATTTTAVSASPWAPASGPLPWD